MTPQYILQRSLSQISDQGDRRRAESELANLQWAEAYAEPGYQQGRGDSPLRGILFADWNPFPKRALDLVEQQGWELEWSDEWTLCSGCMRAIRTSPDSYGWQPSFAIWRDEFVCAECVADDADEFLDTLANNPRTALTLRSIDPAQYGWERYNGFYESGWHPGQNDDPVKIMAEIQKWHDGADVLFQITSVGQFDMRFTAWYRLADDDFE